MIFNSESALQTQKIAAELARKYQQGAVIALSGDLGSGKTVFTQGLAKSLKIKNHLISPTFILIRQYKLPHNISGQLFHIDLYRLIDIQQIENLGLSEIWSNSNNIVVIEWAEKIKKFLPKNTIWVKFTRLQKSHRQIEISEPESELQLG